MEEDIKIIKGFIEFWRTQEVTPVVCEPDVRAMENILQELERLQKDKTVLEKLSEQYFLKIEELEKESKKYKRLYETQLKENSAKQEDYCNHYCLIAQEYKNSVSKEKIEQKIEEFNKRIKQYQEYVQKGTETDLEYYENIANTLIVRELQELLEEEK